MNELRVRAAIKDLIVDNKTVLVQGLFAQGQPRKVHQVTYSASTPPTGYFFVNVSTSTNRDRIRPGFGQTGTASPSETEYTVIIDVSDYISGHPAEDQLFEKMDAEFQLFTDRIVALLRGSYWLIDSNGLMLRLDNDRTVSKNNFTQSWEEAAQYHSLLYSRITFQVFEPCTDDATLY